MMFGKIGCDRDVRITLDDNVISAVRKISDEIPGAILVCGEILREGENIDPDGIFEGFGILLMLDTYHIYGKRIWLLYKEVCGENVVKMVACIRACQMGLFSIQKLQHAIDNHGEGVNPVELHKMVKEKLPSFADLNLITIIAEK